VSTVSKSPKGPVGQVGKGIGIFEFLDSDPSCGELSLNEAEPDRCFLFIVRTQFHLGRHGCCGEIPTDLLSHGGRV
jgi:hypothetical protein